MKWDEILLTALASAVFTGSLAFVFQSWIGELFSKRLDRFRKDLERDAFEYETRFTKLHEKQAEVITELYEQLVRTQRALQDWLNHATKDWETREKKRDAAIEAADKLSHYFEEHRLYLSAKVSASLLTFQKHFDSVESDLLKASILSREKWEPSSDDPTFRGLVETLTDAAITMRLHIAEVRRELERDCREMLGYPDTDFQDTET